MGKCLKIVNIKFEYFLGVLSLQSFHYMIVEWDYTAMTKLWETDPPPLPYAPPPPQPQDRPLLLIFSFQLPQLENLMSFSRCLKEQQHFDDFNNKNPPNLS